MVDQRIKGRNPDAQDSPGNSDPEHGKLPIRSCLQHLLEANQQNSGFVENIPDVIYSLDDTGTLLTINRSVEAYGFTVDELIGQSFIQLIHPDDRHQVVSGYYEGVTSGKNHVRTQQFRLLTRTDAVRWIEANSIVRFTPEGDFIAQEGVCRDITHAIRTQEELEAQVRIRTAALVHTNEELQKEILDRCETEHQLREREADLQMEKDNLQETNMALMVLLKRRDSDKQAFEEQVMYNVKTLVLPYLDKLKATVTNEDQKAYLSILETHLSDVTAAFSRRLSIEFHSLTPSELKVANFIRLGKRSREIAALLGLSQRTIDAYRLSIRRKLRINNKKANLRTMLMSMQ